MLTVSLHRQFDYLEVALADPQWPFNAIRIAHCWDNCWVWPIHDYGIDQRNHQSLYGPLTAPRKRKRIEPTDGIASGAFTHRYQDGELHRRGVHIGIANPQHGRFVKVRMALDGLETAEPIMIAYNLIRGGWCIMMTNETATHVKEQVPGLYVPGWRQAAFVEATPESIKA